MKATTVKPTVPGWYWYGGDEVTSVCAVRVFQGDEYHGFALIADVPVYHYFPKVEDLTGLWWSDEAIPDPPVFPDPPEVRPDEIFGDRK